MEMANPEKLPTEAPYPALYEVNEAPEFIEPDPTIEGVDSHAERTILYLLAQPTFQVAHPKASAEIRGALDLTKTQWEKTCRMLRNQGIIAPTSASDSIYDIQLDPVAIVDKGLGKQFVSIRVLGAIEQKAHLIPDDLVDPQQPSLETRVRSARLRATNQKERKESLQKAQDELADKRQETEHYKILATQVFKQVDIKQKSVRINNGRALVFQFPGFATRYDPNHFAELNPLHKALLSIGNASTFQQNAEQHKQYIDKLINKNVTPPTTLSSMAIQRIIEQGMSLNLIEGEDEKYKLQADGIGVLKVMRADKISMKFF